MNNLNKREKEKEKRREREKKGVLSILNRRQEEGGVN